MCTICMGLAYITRWERRDLHDVAKCVQGWICTLLYVYMSCTTSPSGGCIICMVCTLLYVYISCTPSHNGTPTVDDLYDLYDLHDLYNLYDLYIIYMIFMI